MSFSFAIFNLHEFVTISSEYISKYINNRCQSSMLYKKTEASTYKAIMLLILEIHRLIELSHFNHVYRYLVYWYCECHVFLSRRSIMVMTHIVLSTPSLATTHAIIHFTWEQNSWLFPCLSLGFFFHAICRSTESKENYYMLSIYCH